MNNPDTPAQWISVNDVLAFIDRLNAISGETYRLPSEAEWEYACRAGTTTKYYFGDDPGDGVIKEYAWVWGNCENIGHDYPHVVGRKLPNAFALYDMHGNQYEICADQWHWTYDGAPADGSVWNTPPDNEGRFVIRGGSFKFAPSYTRSSRRINTPQPYNDTYFDIGFRLAKDGPPPEK